MSEERWLLKPKKPQGRDRMICVRSESPIPWETEVVPAAELEAERTRRREDVERLINAIETWNQQTGHGEPWEAQRQADSDLRAAAREARSLLASHELSEGET